MVDFDMLLDHRNYYKDSLDLEIVENEQLFGLVTTSREYGIVLYLEDNKLYQGQLDPDTLMRHGKGWQMILDEEDGGNFFYGHFLQGQYDSFPKDLLVSPDPLLLTVKPCLYVWLNDREVYFGGFREGCQNGFGEVYKLGDNLSRMLGYLQNGMREGLGMQEKETSYYVGEYQKDKSSGLGIYSSQGIERYAGEWENGCFNGHGFHDSKAYGVPFMGLFQADSRVQQS
jgi:hypothetical protein